jgi:uncharacterized protein
VKSPKERSLDSVILRSISGRPRQVAQILLQDKEIEALQEYGNTVAIKRLGYNDHGPVHMRKVLLNAVTMVNLLHDAGIKTSLESEEIGTFEDSTIAIILASFLHDLGMTVSRQDHEEHSAMLAMPIFDRLLKQVYPRDIGRQVTIRSLAIEGIVGHMAARKVHSVEAGVVLVADGSDMERGRARIPMMMNTESKVGDIHKYSATSIERVLIEKGEVKPIRITIHMSSDVGFFQVEEVLIPKINWSPIKPYLELCAGVTGQQEKRYL